MPTGARADGLTLLTLPAAPSDRMLVSRAGVLGRHDLGRMHGGFSIRKPSFKPATADFPTWLNQGAAALTDHGDVLSLEHPATITSGINLIGLERPLPAGNWDVMVGCRRLWNTRENLLGGIYLRETASGKIETFGFGHGWLGFGLLQSRYSDPTSPPSDRQRSSEYPDFAWFRFRKWAGMFMPLFSADGVTWAQFNTGIFLENFFATAPDRWGFFMHPVNNAVPAVAQRMDVFDWSEAAETDLFPQFGSYKNADGQGDRRPRITVTTNATLAGAPLQNLVDGQFLNGLSPWWHSGQSGRHLTFQFAEPKIVTEARWFQSAFTPQGTWKWQGSHDGSNWSGISTEFLLDAGPGGAEIGNLSKNAAAYSHYRIVQTAGVTDDNPFLREIEFKLRTDERLVLRS